MEIVVECLDVLKEETKAMVEKSMLVGGDFYLEKLNIKADAATGESWYSAKG